MIELYISYVQYVYISFGLCAALIFIIFISAAVVHESLTLLEHSTIPLKSILGKGLTFLKKCMFVCSNKVIMMRLPKKIREYLVNKD